MTTPISRRTVTKGAAWSVPALAVAGAAPALATSTTVYTAQVCRITTSDATVNAQQTQVHFAFLATDGAKVKKDTTYTFTVTATAPSGGTAPSEPTIIAGTNMTLRITDSATSGLTRTFTLTITVNADIDPQCGTSAIKWQNSDTPIAGKSTITIAPVSGTVPAGTTGSVTGKGLKFNNGWRYRTSVNDTSRIAPVDILQYSCIPTVRFQAPQANEKTTATSRCINGANCVVATTQPQPNGNLEVPGTCTV